MRRHLQVAIMVGVATAIPASPLVLAQIQKAATPAQKVAVEVKVGGIDVVKAVKVERKVVDIKDAAVLKAMDGADPNQEPQVRQFMQQFRPALRSEYYFLRTVCKPSPEQRTLIAREGEKALRGASKAFVDAQGRPVQIRNGRALYPDPRRLIEEAMAKAVEPHLTPDQATSYWAELNKRAADRKQAAARNIVAKLDGDLILTPDQRDKIAEAMTSQWDETWVQSLETLLHGDQYYPRLPDGVVVPHLDEKQRDVWHGSRSNQNSFFGFVGNMMPQEDAQDDKELIEARQAAEKARPPMPPVRRGGGPAIAVPPPGVIERPAAPARPAAAKDAPAKK